MKDCNKLKDGDRCLYISIPYDNDWSKIKFKSGVYKKENYAQCFVVHDDDNGRNIMNSKIKRIKELFSNSKFEIANDIPFYRVIVSYNPNISTVKAKESNNKDELTNQLKDYKDNCFKNKSDAEHVANSIKEILDC